MWEFTEEVVEVELVSTSAYGDDGVHSREAAETRGEKRRFATLALRRKKNNPSGKKRVVRGKEVKKKQP